MEIHRRENSIIPSYLSITRSNINTQNKTADNIITGQSSLYMSLDILIGDIKIIIPKTNPMLAMFDPKTFEIAKSDEPKKADLILTISSGADVAKDTTVIPIKIFAILNLRDIETADFRSKFPPKINSAKPKNKTKNVFGSIFF